MNIKDDWLNILSISAPLFASSMALIYDVGFFFGANISFFTFFSFSEHLVFALQVIPFAFPAALGVLSTIGALWYGYQKNEREISDVVSKAQAMSLEERQALVDKLKRRVKIFKVLNPFVQGLIIAYALWLVGGHNYSMAFIVVASQIAAAMVYRNEGFKSRNLQIVLASFSIMAGWAIAFSIGYERSQSILTAKTPSERLFLDQSEVPINLVRAGERGVLFVTFENRKLTFLRWESIKKIETL